MSGARPVVVAWTGASGMIYGLRLVQCLLEAGEEVWLLYSRAAQVVLAMENDLELPGQAEAAAEVLRGRWAGAPGRLRVFGREQWSAPVASGSARARAMVICPCTTGTLAAVAAGQSDSLLERAADVMLKEGRRLILVPRETPLSVIHLENMLRLARAGAVILPANPGFYHRPAGLEGLADFIVARILDQLEIAHDLVPRWGE